jgi:hypothetical protein
MRGLALDFHPWRGLFRWPSEPDLFHFRITLGFVSILVCKFCVADRFASLANKIRDLEGK